MTDWQFDQDLSGTFADAKEALGLPLDQPLPDPEDAS